MVRALCSKLPEMPELLIKISMPSGANSAILSDAAYNKVERALYSATNVSDIFWQYTYVFVLLQGRHITLTESALTVSRVTVWILLLLFTSSCNFSDFSGVRAQAKTVWPLADSCLTNSSPRPREAPVTTNVRDMMERNWKKRSEVCITCAIVFICADFTK